MTAIDRTAYPRPGARLTRDELGARYSLSDTDFDFIRASARGDSGRMLLATLLKTRQDLGYFATPDEIHPGHGLVSAIADGPGHSACLAR